MSYFRHAAQSLADALDFSAAQLALAAAPFPAAEITSAAGSNPAAGEDRPAAGREWLNGFSQPQDPLAARTVPLTPLLSGRNPITRFHPAETHRVNSCPIVCLPPEGLVTCYLSPLSLAFLSRLSLSPLTPQILPQAPEAGRSVAGGRLIDGGAVAGNAECPLSSEYRDTSLMRNSAPLGPYSRDTYPESYITKYSSIRRVSMAGAHNLFRHGRGGSGPLQPGPSRGAADRGAALLAGRIHFIIEMIWWTGLAPWEFEFPFPGSLISTFLSDYQTR